MAIQAGETTFYQAKRGIVQDGLVLNLDAAVDASYDEQTIWKDLVQSNNGTFVNMDSTNFDKSNGGSLVFDGTNEYIYGGDTSQTITNACCCCAWFKATGAPSHNDIAGGMIFGQSDAYDHGLVIAHSWANQTISLGTYINNALRSDNGSAATNSFIFVVGQQDGSKQEIFVNNVLVKERAYTTAPNVSNPAYQIGRWGWTTWGRYFNGHIYGVSVYNRALTSDEVARNYNATRHRFGV